MRILGIDPGTAIVGFGVIDVDAQIKTMIDAGVIRTPANQPLELRLETIYSEINEIIKANQPEVMVIEQLFFGRNVTTAISVSHARGVIVLAGHNAGLQIEEFTPPQIKQALTGMGNADKRQVQDMVRLLLNLKEAPQPDDCADALAAALTFAP